MNPGRYALEEAELVTWMKVHTEDIGDFMTGCSHCELTGMANGYVE